MHKSTEQIMSQIYELKIAKPGETYVEGMFRVTHDRYFRQYDRIFKAWVDKEHSREISIHGISEINGQDKSMSLESSSLDLGAYLEGRPMTVISTAQSHINPSKVRQSHVKLPESTSRSEVKFNDKPSTKMTKKPQGFDAFIQPTISRSVYQSEPKTTNELPPSKPSQQGVDFESSNFKKPKQQDIPIILQRQTISTLQKVKQEASLKPEPKTQPKLQPKEELKVELEEKMQKEGTQLKIDEEQRVQDAQEVVEQEQSPSYYDLITKQQNSMPAMPKEQHEPNNEIRTKNEPVSSPSEIPKAKQNSLIEAEANSPSLTESNRQLNKIVKTGSSQIALGNTQQLSSKQQSLQQQEQDKKSLPQMMQQQQQSNIAESSIVSKPLGKNQSDEDIQKDNDSATDKDFRNSGSGVEIQESYNQRVQASSLERDQRMALQPEREPIDYEVTQNQTFNTAEEPNESDRFYSFTQNEANDKNKESLYSCGEQQIFDYRKILDQGEDELIERRVQGILANLIEKVQQQKPCQKCQELQIQKDEMEKETQKLRGEVEEIRKDNLRFKENNLNLVKKIEELENKVKKLEEDNFVDSNKVNQNRRRQRSQQLNKQSHSQEEQRREYTKNPIEAVHYSVEYESQKNSSEEEKSQEAYEQYEEEDYEDQQQTTNLTYPSELDPEQESFAN